MSETFWVSLIWFGLGIISIIELKALLAVNEDTDYLSWKYFLFKGYRYDVDYRPLILFFLAIGGIGTVAMTIMNAASIKEHIRLRKDIKQIKLKKETEKKKQKVLDSGWDL